MPAADLPLLIEAARKAGAIATHRAGDQVKRWDKPGDAGPVTEADIAVNDMLLGHLRTARPDYGWLSEESENDRARLDAERVFIVDPIDGTRSYIAGERTWAHSLAVAQRGVVTAAVIYLPQLDKLYAAAAGQGAWLNDQPIKGTNCDQLTGASIIAAKPNFAPEHWRAEVPQVKRSYRPSLAYRLSLVAEGRYDAMLVMRQTWEWDIAAGDLITREAGLQISNRTAAQLIYNNPVPLLDGVVAASPKLHGQITGALIYGPDPAD